MASYLSHHVLPIDKGFEPADCRTLPQWEDVLGLDGHFALVGVLLENYDLLGWETRGRDASEENLTDSAIPITVSFFPQPERAGPSVCTSRGRPEVGAADRRCPGVPL